ncbi:hypothetical protein OQA88_5051 [Cercophora sp. LCS_1]
MSGFEVAGVVLGSIPIIVSALQLHAKSASALHRWRYYSRELKHLLRNLQTEQTRLETVFEKLLSDAVRDGLIEEMISRPFGPLWKDPETASRIRRRLGRGPRLFESIVQDMSETMDELKKRLDIEPNGEIKWAQTPGVKKELKRIIFVLQRSEYDSLLTEIGNGISRLESLLKMGIDIEPHRHRRSRTRMFRSLRHHSGSIHAALQSALTCPCLHDVGLRLIHPPSNVVLESCEDDDLAASIPFHVAFSSKASTPETSRKCAPDSKHWGLLELSFRKLGARPAAARSSRVAFSVPPIDSQGSRASNSSPALSNIQNLCEAIAEAQANTNIECCGHITDCSLSSSPSSYQVSFLDQSSYGTGWSLASLESLLSHDSSSSFSLGFGHRLRLACMVASSIVQFRGTQWLKRPPTNNDIYVVRREDGGLYLEDVFVSKLYPDTQQCTQPNFSPNINTRNPTLMALGVLLIELIFCQMMKQLLDVHRRNNSRNTTPGGTTPTPASDYQTLMMLVGKLHELGGARYAKAVRICIKSELFNEEGYLDGDSLKRDVFLSVLALLEEDLETADAS